MIMVYQYIWIPLPPVFYGIHGFGTLGNLPRYLRRLRAIRAIGGVGRQTGLYLRHRKPRGSQAQFCRSSKVANPCFCCCVLVCVAIVLWSIIIISILYHILSSYCSHLFISNHDWLYLFFQSAGVHRSPLCYAWWWRWSWPHWASSPSPLSSSGSRKSLETVIYMLYIQSYSFGWILTPKGGKGNPAQMTSMTLFSVGDCLDIVIIHLMDTWNTSFCGHFSWTRHKKSRTRCFMEALNTATLVFTDSAASCQVAATSQCLLCSPGPRGTWRCRVQSMEELDKDHKNEYQHNISQHSNIDSNRLPFHKHEKCEFKA